jgi:hypothetical protein
MPGAAGARTLRLFTWRSRRGGGESHCMLLKHRPPDIDSSPVALSHGFSHLDQGWAAVIRWLIANKVDYVLIGSAALAIRGDVSARGPVAIVPAPYGRNFDRLASALVAQNAGLRSDRVVGADRGVPVPVKLTAEKLARGRRWLLRFAGYDLDIEAAGKHADDGRGSDGDAVAPRYQELLYESNRFELSPGMSVEVASPEDLEHYFHVRRTGVAPEFRVIRNTPARDLEPDDDVSGGLTGPGLDAGGDITAARVKPEERGDAGPAGSDAPQ